MFGGTWLRAVGFALCLEEVFSALLVCSGHCSLTASCSQLSDALEKKALAKPVAKLHLINAPLGEPSLHFNSLVLFCYREISPRW